MQRELDPEEQAQKENANQKGEQKRRRKKQPGVRCGSHSIQGYIRSDPSKVNQDSRVELPSIPSEPSASIFGVLDGHGANGHSISQHIAKYIVDSVGKQRQRLRRTPQKHLGCIIDDVVAQLRSVQAAVRNGVARKGTELEASHSGTTAVVSLKLRGRLHTANVGDSRAIICRLKKEEQRDSGADADIDAVSSKEGGGKPDKHTSRMKVERMRAQGMDLEVIALSKDHKPDDPKEKKRILKAGGRVMALGPKQPMRVFGAAGFGLAVSRSLGDFALHPFVSNEPDITEHVLQREDLFAVWASDGVWEYMGNLEVARMIVESDALATGGLDAAARMVCNRAREMWKAQTDGAYQDDITCVIAQLNDVPEEAAGDRASIQRTRSVSDGVASTCTEILGTE